LTGRKTSFTSNSPEETYPLIVRKGSVSVRVYRVKNAKRGEVFEVTWFKEGLRHRKSFRQAGDARKHAEFTAKALDAGKGASLALNGAELESYRLSKRILAEMGGDLPMHSIVQEYVSSKKLLGNESLLAAIQHHVAMKSVGALKAIKVSDLVADYIRAKENDGVSKDYLRDCRFRLGRFAKDFQTDIAKIKSADLDAWLRSFAHSGRSRNNTRGLLVTLFRFARSAGHLPRGQMTEAEHLSRAKDKGGEIEIFSVDELSRLLNASGNAVLPYIALGAFAGIRTAEIHRLTWDSIRWGQRVIEIKAGMAKTSQRRLIPLLDNLVLWLQQIPDRTGPIVKLARPEKTAREIVAVSCQPIVTWKHNALRHSYASYRLAVIQDAGKLALEMGNSPSMVFRHYRELVTVEEANAWFAIVPKKASENDKPVTEPSR
jgi:integrase